MSACYFTNILSTDIFWVFERAYTFSSLGLYLMQSKGSLCI
jgi:hypothetical protein